MEKKYSASELRALANELKMKTHGEGYENFYELQEAMRMRTALLNVASYIERIEQEAIAQLEKDIDGLFNS